MQELEQEPVQVELASEAEVWLVELPEQAELGELAVRVGSDGSAVPAGSAESEVGLELAGMAEPEVGPELAESVELGVGGEQAGIQVAGVSAEVAEASAEAAEVSPAE